jgi:hypothetical protein
MTGTKPRLQQCMRIPGFKTRKINLSQVFAGNRRGQPHAELTHAPEQEMRSSLTEDREAVPERGDEER